MERKEWLRRIDKENMEILREKEEKRRNDGYPEERGGLEGDNDQEEGGQEDKDEDNREVEILGADETFVGRTVLGGDDILVDNGGGTGI